MSMRARKQQPWCIDCGTTSALTADHIIPIAERPDLAYEELNITVRCRTCNGRRADHCTDADRNQVLAAIAARVKRQSSSRAPSQPGLHQALMTRVSYGSGAPSVS
ncbi:HNH endonuclease [Mycobacteroides chelonae]|uniref:HNH endonuclease n=1 Tax=Mycobacteroides chelonae TaxID=1774 RepID=UPI0013F4D125|nr:HNH endonuclease [Mycobacteroides chelonae]